MQRYRNHQYYGEAQTSEEYQQPAKGLLSFRAEGQLYVYWTPTDEKDLPEVLVGYGNQPFEIDMPPGKFRLACDNRVWISETGKPQHSLTPSDDVFTTLDRPAPLSPEMAAIARLVRQNSMEREVIRERMEHAEQTYADLREQQLRGTDELDVVDDPEDHAETSGDTKPSKAKSPKRKVSRAAKSSEDAEDDIGPGGNDNAGD